MLNMRREQTYCLSVALVGDSAAKRKRYMILLTLYDSTHDIPYRFKLSFLYTLFIKLKCK